MYLLFFRCQGKGTFGLGHKLTSTRSTDKAVFNKDNAINNAKIKNIAIGRYVPRYTPSISNQPILSKQILSKLSTELQCVERSVFMEKVNTQNFWPFELGTEEDINFSIWIIAGFEQRNRQHSQNLNNDTF